MRRLDPEWLMELMVTLVSIGAALLTALIVLTTVAIGRSMDRTECLRATPVRECPTKAAWERLLERVTLP